MLGNSEVNWCNFLNGETRYLASQQQCDQMVRLFFNIWQLATMKISPIMHQIGQSRLNIWPKRKILTKCVKDLYNFARVAKFHQIYSHWPGTTPTFYLKSSSALLLCVGLIHKLKQLFFNRFTKINTARHLIRYVFDKIRQELIFDRFKTTSW